MIRELRRFDACSFGFPPTVDSIFSWAKAIAPMAREITAEQDHRDRRWVIRAHFPAVLPIRGCGNPARGV